MNEEAVTGPFKVYYENQFKESDNFCTSKLRASKMVNGMGVNLTDKE